MMISLLFPPLSRDANEHAVHKDHVHVADGKLFARQGVNVLDAKLKGQAGSEGNISVADLTTKTHALTESAALLRRRW